ncbi:hypothetical protein PCASD_11530 [Puccinia coronata f. sp. avenae]|uniref:Uncharacterized protein n=1 Tax=Puccinia coronata f. sp. avenae TaxID=200324 RepID=A0A2N5ULT3_9BASI|nr:hypothetical protein PCASD_11530 [Puccinia coronata f. sp. avenae]
MGFYAYLLLCVLAGLFLVQAQLLPSSILCASSHNATITRDDCKRSLALFSSESNVIFWSAKTYSHSCGTCRLSITKPSLPHSDHHAAVFADVLTALHQGMDKCKGRPTNATIGISEPVSVLLDFGNGAKC